MGRTAKELLLEVAKRLGRTPEDVTPFAALLEKNWYEDEKSIKTLSVEEVQAIGVPLRVAKELGDIGALRTVVADPQPGDKGKFGRNKDRQRGGKGGKDKAPDERGGDAGAEKGGKAKKEYAFEKKIPIDTSGTEKDFGWKSRIVGDGFKNVKHIREVTGTEVWVRGGSGRQGTSEEDMHIHVFAEAGVKESEFQQAVDMAEDLLESVHQDFYAWADKEEDGGNDDGASGDEKHEGGDRRRAKGKGKRRFKGKSKGEKGEKGRGRDHSEKGRHDRGGKGKGNEKGKGKGNGKRHHDDDRASPNKRRRF